jgi:hypothetical protein
MCRNCRFPFRLLTALQAFVLPIETTTDIPRSSETSLGAQIRQNAEEKQEVEVEAHVAEAEVQSD